MASPQRTAPQPDESLMSRIQQRLDEAAISELVSRYLRRGVAVARQILWDRSLADDAVQEAFVRPICSRDIYDPAKPFSVWFFTILGNACLGMIRRQGLEAEAMQAMAVEPVAQTEPVTDRPLWRGQLMPQSQILSDWGCPAGAQRQEKRQVHPWNAYLDASVGFPGSGILRPECDLGNKRKSCRINADGVFGSHSVSC